MDENTRREVKRIIDRAKRPSDRGDWRMYGYYKNDLHKLDLNTYEYERAVWDLARAMGI